MELRKPIFIVSAGRSGSTIFHQVFSEHPNVAWMSRLCSDFPRKLWVNRLFLNAIDIPFTGKMLLKHLHPAECYGFWDFYCNGFSQPCRDLLSTDVTGGMMNVKSAIAQITTKKRDNLLIRITGWPRMGFLQKIFGPAKFIHVLRDGRGFANSIMNQPWWRGWQGPDNWRWGELTESQRSEWEKHNKSFVALAGIQWNILMDAFEKSAEEIDPENYTVVKYEDLCSDPVDTYRKVTEFCDLEWSNQFEKAICKYSLRSLNEKWKREFTDKQIEILESVTGDYLGKYGYI